MRMVVNIDVPELPAAMEFYSTALGLTSSRILDGDVAELNGAGCTIYLLAAAPDSSPCGDCPETRRYARHWTPVHIDFVVEYLEAAAQRALRAGAKQESACVAWRGSRCITFSDPFGHGFCLLSFSGASYTG